LRFEQKLLEGTLLRRLKRSEAVVRLRDGNEITAHCINPGSLTGCAEPGSRVLLSERPNPHRRYPHQLEISYSGRTAVGVHAGRPITLATEAIMEGKIGALMGYATLRSDPKSLRVDGVDFVLEGNGLRPCFICVKSVSMAYEGIAYYPDTVMPKGPVRLTALTDLVREGQRAMMIFMVLRNDVESFRPADHIDADYAVAFRDAVARGVETLCFRAKVTRKGIELDKPIPIDLGD
jgi:sugar fermentation stimulation protein A